MFSHATPYLLKLLVHFILFSFLSVCFVSSDSFASAGVGVVAFVVIINIFAVVIVSFVTH